MRQDPSQQTQRCKGCPYSGRAIGIWGDITADIVFVGEAPGAQEIINGRPFIGPAGELLWKTTLDAGLPNKAPRFVTNALSCRPPAKKPIKQQAIKACHGRLVDEVFAYPRKLIIALGNTAIRSLMMDKDLKITQIRGRMFKVQAPNGTEVPVIPILHPAAILRAMGDKPKFVTDMKKAIGLYNGEEVVPDRDPGQTRWIIVNDDNFHLAEQVLMNCDYVAADIETDGFDPRQNKILVLGIAYKKNRVFVFPPDMIPKLKHVFLEGPKFIWHNGKFDSEFLHAMGLEVNIDEDTMLEHYALDENRGIHDLGSMSTELIGAPPYKDEVKQWVGQYGTFADIPFPQLCRRVSLDCDYTLQSWHELNPRIEADENLHSLYRNVLLPASKFLQQVERRGILVSKKRLKEIQEEYTKKVDWREQVVVELSQGYWDPEKYVKDTGAKKQPKKFNPNSSQQLTWLLYTQLRLKPPPGFKKDTTKETMAVLPRHPIVKAIGHLRKDKKLLSTYINGVEVQISVDGRIHSTFLIHGTVNGRLSSRKPNLQNIPREGPIKSMFIARKGYIFVEVDYDQAELRCLAHFSQDEFLLRCYQEDRKLHHEVAIEMYGRNYTEAQYIRAKAINFGIAYGRTEHSIAKEFRISLEAARELREAWLRRMPRAAAFIERCRRAAEKRKTLVSPLGRKRRFARAMGDSNELQNEASNFPMSSTATDLTLLSAIRAQRRIRKYDAHYVNLVHDSGLIECPNDPAVIQKVIRIVTEEMKAAPIRILHTNVPFEVDAKIGKRWSDMKKSAAERAGKLAL